MTVDANTFNLQGGIYNLRVAAGELAAILGAIVRNARANQQRSKQP